MFLLGIHHITEGIKGFAGDALRQGLQKLFSGKWSGIFSGTLFTALIQSSSAALLTVIGFVSAGMVTFPQAIAVILGANLGTTATSWLVAFFGFKVKISAAALPMVGLGAFFWLLAKGRTRAVGAVLAGFGLVFTGIEFLQTGMAGVEWNLDAIGQGPFTPWILAGIGVVMTIVMQSSSAAGATTLVALAAGTLTLDQALAMVVGQNIGTTATAVLASIGGSLAVKRTVLAHVFFNLVVGIVALFFINQLSAVARWLGTLMHDDGGVLTLAAFHTLFNVLGIALFFPWIGTYAHLIEWLTGRGKISAVSRLDSTVAKAGGAVAIEAAWHAVHETAHDVLLHLKTLISGQDSAPRDFQAELDQIATFVESLTFEGTEPTSFADRRIKLWHALDHLSKLIEVLEKPTGIAFSQDHIILTSARQALDHWLADPSAPPADEKGSEPSAELESISKTIAEERRQKRAELLHKVALNQLKPNQANSELARFRWLDSAFYHTWRLVNSLKTNS